MARISYCDQQVSVSSTEIHAHNSHIPSSSMCKMVKYYASGCTSSYLNNAGVLFRFPEGAKCVEIVQCLDRSCCLSSNLVISLSEDKMRVDWNSDGMRMWKEGAVKEQKGYFDLFGGCMWREFGPSDYNNLKRNIGFALFGLPEKEPDKNLNDGTGYTEKQVKHINKIFGIIKKCMKKHADQEIIWVSFLLVSGKARDDYMRFPVIRIHEHDITVQENNDIFIDFCGRVYKDWYDYLKNNTLPRCVLCYPKSGVYSVVDGVIEVEFGISPAGKAGRKVLQGFDIGGTVLGVGASGVGIAALCVPVAWPVVAGAAAASVLTGGYAVGRNVQTLVDRSQHQQSISLVSSESRNCWLGIGGSVMSLASAGAMAAVAKTAQGATTITLAGQIAIKSVTVASCVVNALGVTSALAGIIMKAANKEEITPLEIFQFTSVVLFFTNSVISAHQAHSLINSIGKNSTGQFSGDTQVFRNQISEFVKQTKVCKGIPQFVTGCSPTISFTLEETFFGICRWLSRKLIDITRSLKKGLISICNYMLKVEEFLRTFWESWKNEMAEVIGKICKAFGVKHWSEMQGAEPDHIRELAGTVIVERKSLANCGATVMPSQQSQVISENDTVVGTAYNRPNSLAREETDTSLSYDNEIINILAKFVDREMCRNPADFSRYMTFICEFVKNQFQEEKSRYEKMCKIVKSFMSVEDFDKQYGISGNPDNHFFQEVFKKFKGEGKDGFTLLKLAYESQNACTQAQSSFDVNGVNFYPFYNKLGLASNGMLSKEQYCEIAAELTGHLADRDSICMSLCGATAVMQVNGGADVITVQCLLEDGKVSGIAALLSSPSE